MAARVLTAVRSHLGRVQAAAASTRHTPAGVGAGEWLIAGLCALAVVLALFV